MSMPEAIRSLYPRVTAAIMRAENAEARGDGSARDAYREVSRIEEEISSLLAASSAQGALSRRGAVRAALAAGDERRAEALAARFTREPGSEKLRAELAEILAEAGFDEARIERLFPPAALSLAERLFPVEIGADGRLYQAPAPLAEDPAIAEGDAAALYAEMRRALAELAAILAIRNDGASLRCARKAQAALMAAPEPIESCSPLGLDRALRSLVAVQEAASADTAFGPALLALLADVARFFEILPEIFPALDDYRKSMSYDSFVSPSTEVRETIIQMLAHVAKNRKIVGDSLAVEISNVELAVVAAPDIAVLAPDREAVWEAADAHLGADIRIEALEIVSEAQIDRGEEWREFHNGLKRPAQVRQWRVRAFAA